MLELTSGTTEVGPFPATFRHVLDFTDKLPAPIDDLKEKTLADQERTEEQYHPNSQPADTALQDFRATPPLAPPPVDLIEMMKADLAREAEMHGGPARGEAAGNKDSMIPKSYIKTLLVWLACRELLPQRLTFLLRGLRHD